MNRLLKFILFTIGIISILLFVAILRVLISPDLPVLAPCASSDNDFISDSSGLSKRLSEALKFQTISYSFHTYKSDEIKKFTSFIFKSFPLIHSSPLVSKEVVNNLSLLYYIKGTNSDLKPYLLTGHMDVVPVEESYWEEPPFSGIIKNGYVWGRGTLDCKQTVLGTLEALEFLLKKGYKPKRSFYLAYGHDEEVGGLDGAKHIANLLQSRKVELEYILDEGSVVFDKFIPGIEAPIALVSVSEKGALDLELKVQSKPGHSSMPYKETAIVILAKALSKLEGDVFPSMFGKGTEEKMFEELAHCAPFSHKIVFKNLWLFKIPLILYMSSPIMSPFHRTTTAVTIVSGGSKINVLPSNATAYVNLRVHPAQTINEAVDFVKKVINDDRVEIKIVTQTPPHPISPMNSFGYNTIAKSIRQMYNDTCVVPFTLIANTDSRWYLDLTKNVYRFSLSRLLPQDVNRIHGNNERISVKNYEETVNFYLHLIKNSDNVFSNSEHTHNEL